MLCQLFSYILIFLAVFASLFVASPVITNHIIRFAAFLSTGLILVVIERMLKGYVDFINPDH
jgi:type III secretory pathway component EscS